MIRKIWFQNRQNIEKIAQKTKKAQNVVFNLKGRISLLYYCVKHIHGQFKTYLKLLNIRFKQIAKTIPTVGKAVIFFLKQFCFVSYKYLNLHDTISVDMSCFHCAVWCLDAVLHYCVFGTCKVKSVLKLLYFERYSFTFHFTKFLSHFPNKLMLNRNYFLILVKKSFHHCVYILSRNREK